MRKAWCARWLGFGKSSPDNCACDHVGQDVAIEALRDCLRQRKATPSDIYEMAKIDRVTKTIRPYLEALI